MRSKNAPTTTAKGRKVPYLLTTLASAAALALVPSAAGAQTAGMVYGATYGDCYEAFGWYEWTADGSAGGYPKYDTDGSIEVIQLENCNSWIDKGILQYSGKKWQNGGWTTLGWRQPPGFVGGDGSGPGEIDYFVDFKDVRDIRFRVCNVHDGIVDGCSSVS
ncbi:hypothetical protein [Streptomyces cadmiisoli]|uniref:hypothetical protein n=1 Tax=Streptomyces cadmiisoli TaxID=2184053 RepID=UPI003D71D7F8